MLYSEFLEGTKARDNEHNYHVYKTLEGLYMDSNASKEEVYKAAKPFLNNEDTEEQKAFKAELYRQIETAEENIRFYQTRIEVETNYINCLSLSKKEIEASKATIRSYRRQIRSEKRVIERLKMVLRIN